MKKSSNYQRTLKEILDSDDELTFDYNESSYVPAYQDDTRFEYIEKLRTNYLKDERITDGILHSTISSTEDHATRAIFNKKDAYCFQCIQRMSKDNLLWFFKFLLFKDLHSNYKFLKSCLVPKYKNYYSIANK